MTASPGTLAAALAAAERGWHVFPLRPGDKRPAVKDWQARATTDPERIVRCWSAGPFGIGIACGPSGLLVVDLDTPKPDSAPLPAPFDAPDVHDGADVLAVLAERHGRPYPFGTYSVRTGRGGWHLYFDADEAGGPVLGNSAGRIGPLIDTRGAGGYVVGAGSAVAGNPYTIVHDGTADRLPGWIGTLLAPPPAPVRRAVPGAGPREGFRGAVRLAPLLQVVLDAPEGTRNQRLYWAAAKMFAHARNGDVDQSAAAEALVDAARMTGLTDREARATVTSAGRSTAVGA